MQSFVHLLVDFVVELYNHLLNTIKAHAYAEYIHEWEHHFPLNNAKINHGINHKLHSSTTGKSSTAPSTQTLSLSRFNRSRRCNVVRVIRPLYGR